MITGERFERERESKSVRRKEKEREREGVGAEKGSELNCEIDSVLSLSVCLSTCIFCLYLCPVSYRPVSCMYLTDTKLVVGPSVNMIVYLSMCLRQQ